MMKMNINEKVNITHLLKNNMNNLVVQNNLSKSNNHVINDQVSLLEHNSNLHALKKQFNSILNYEDAFQQSSNDMSKSFFQQNLKNGAYLSMVGRDKFDYVSQINRNNQSYQQSQSQFSQNKVQYIQQCMNQIQTGILLVSQNKKLLYSNKHFRKIFVNFNSNNQAINTGSHFAPQIKNRSQSTYSNINTNYQANSDNLKAFSQFLQLKIQMDYQYQQQNKTSKDTQTQNCKTNRSKKKKSLIKLETKLDQILEEQRLTRELQRQSSPKNKQKQEQFGSVIYNQYHPSKPTPSSSNINYKNGQLSPRSQIRKLTTVEVVTNSDKKDQVRIDRNQINNQERRLSIDCKSLGHIGILPSILVQTQNQVPANPQINSSVNQSSNFNSHLNVNISPTKTGSNTIFGKNSNKKNTFLYNDKQNSNYQLSVDQSTKRVLQCAIPSSIKKIFSKKNLQVDDIINYLIIHSVSPQFQKMNTDNQILSVGSLESKNTLFSPKACASPNTPLINKTQVNLASKNYFQMESKENKSIQLDQVISNNHLRISNNEIEQDFDPNNNIQDDDLMKNSVEKEGQSTLYAQVEKESAYGEATTTGDNFTCQRSKADTLFSTQKMYNYYIQNNQLHVLVNLCDEEEENEEENSNIVVLEVKFMVFIEIEDQFEEKQVFVQVEDITKLKQFVEDENLEIYKNKILSSITHELKTPLNCSIQMLDMLLQNDDISDVLKQIFIIPALNSNHLLLNIINDILDLAQINYGKFTMFFSEFELSKICAECVNLISMQALQKNLDVELDLDPLIPQTINSDQSRIRQVLLNLLSNALKFTQNGKITIRTHLIEDNLIQVDIEDTGCGIPEKNLNKIIGRFGKKDHQNINHQLNTFGGGLGLTIANNLATGLGGNRRLQVQSIENVGSKFSFCIVNQPLNKVGCNFQYQNLFSQEIIKWDYVSEQKQLPYLPQQIQNQQESNNTSNNKNGSTNGVPQSLISISNKSKKRNDEQSLKSLKYNNPIQSLIKFNTEIMINANNNNNNNSALNHFYHMSSIAKSINEPLFMSQNVNSQIEGVKSKKFQLSFRDLSQHDEQGSFVESSFLPQQQQHHYQQQGHKIKQGDQPNSKLFFNDILVDNIRCESQLTLRMKPDTESNIENPIKQSASYSPAHQYKAYKQYENSFTTQTFQDAKSRQSSRNAKNGNIQKNFTYSELMPQLPSSSLQNSGSLINCYQESKNQKSLKSKAQIYQQDDSSPQESFHRKTNKAKSFLSQFRDQDQPIHLNDKKSRQKELMDDESCEIQFNESSFIQIQEPNKSLNLKVSQKRINNQNNEFSVPYYAYQANQQELVEEKGDQQNYQSQNNLYDNFRFDSGQDFMEIKVQYNDNVKNISSQTSSINQIIQKKLAKKDFNIFSDSFAQIRESAELGSNLSKTMDEIKIAEKHSSLNFKESVYDINQINLNSKETKFSQSPENTKISKLEQSIEKFTQQTLDKYSKIMHNYKQSADANSNGTNKDSIIISENRLSKSQEINFKQIEDPMNQLSYQNMEISKNNSTDNQNKAKLIEYNKNRTCKCSNILIVDDNEFNIYTLEIRLKMYGFITDRATSGMAAIQLVRNKLEINTCCNLYLLIFMDIDMPVKNGYETTSEILQCYKEKKIQKPPPISACTAYVQQSEKAKAIQSGMQFYITKPINQGLLEDTLLQTILNESKMQVKQQKIL
ncbi:ATPase, histidine kinase-, DNA gyrase B (macronuclear) [Tetrahymena thermophila SB210]|uniref:ATPase, histidine kinase-, DNA gyrase B n=1 Tax=Tetrahymena thermophila (strain SB210) TaxID=312017 RepID=Q22D34_TETTS|nr:ATPase, histidine kinase-, DNA gyrase B [Tetrahymena thermophila SB210]EAR83219.2 ATPase, histidine kinase-, DNA gyrase B [Tetrahymena thermophila SB210]|eukprot:XP_001030882.2 ATPase, histidine kinase-, DNA gyrase B [Tetrahymena thermophila SB210]